ncbi:MAG: hypothetical protein FJX65_04945 [Alphaproteobacteria bacterium]|nr:hypothetical protein [Alphaproteobacteria bacterium]
MSRVSRVVERPEDEVPPEELLGGVLPASWPGQWANGAPNPYPTVTPEYLRWDMGRELYRQASDPTSAQGPSYREQFAALGVSVAEPDGTASDASPTLLARTELSPEQPSPARQPRPDDDGVLAPGVLAPEVPDEVTQFAQRAPTPQPNRPAPANEPRPRPPIEDDPVLNPCTAPVRNDPEGSGEHLAWRTTTLDDRKTQWRYKHRGIDLAGAAGQLVGAPRSGVVRSVVLGAKGDGIVEVDMDDGLVMRFLHVTPVPSLRRGARLSIGARVGRIYQSPRPRELPHVHIEVRDPKTGLPPDDVRPDLLAKLGSKSTDEADNLLVKRYLDPRPFLTNCEPWTP